MVDVKVDRGALDDFKRLAFAWADAWADDHGAAYKLINNDVRYGSEYPRLGVFTGAEQFYSTYRNKVAQEVAPSFGALHQMVESLAEACKKIHQQYDSVEALNHAGADSIEGILTEKMRSVGGQGPGGTSAGGQEQPNGANGTPNGSGTH